MRIAAGGRICKTRLAGEEASCYNAASLESAGEPGDSEIESGVTAMRSYRKELWFDVKHRRGVINITPEGGEGGREVVVAVTAGKLDFGPWEQIFYGEFDGKRKKRVLVKIIGE